MRLPIITTALALAAVGACGGSHKSGTTPGGTFTPAGSLAAALETELGTPVAILPSQDGLVAMSADGARTHALVPAPVDWALVDNRAGVVWFGTRDTIRVLDLTLAAPAPEDVVSGMAIEVLEGTPGIAIAYADSTVDLAFGHPAYHRIILTLAAAPTLTGDPGVWTDDEEFPQQVAAHALSPATRTRLAALWQRGAGRALARTAPEAKPTKVPGIDPAECPDDESVCGEAHPIPGTALWRVITSFSCGDACHASYRAYDPATKQFVDAWWIDQLQMAWITDDGRAFIHDGAIIRFDAPRPVHEAPEGVQGGGWLGPSWYVD